ncbi:SDR family oxidoreductase [Panacibacter ginsenosidivorans]|uniref:SDR family oxidoreductase n=1 Tax=Panacibacter ginsenosidivorans TaxID=1813871 RepID=A0A5B8VAV2_9BACT|nr:SDR family oxidoreductase [Panacibacter ginsenosidivorans]QEC68011.1 SDR family oxidoreductase [Panacibacter ginsenosidivorans]
MESIKGKNILIAGATGSIGAALVKLLMDSGANVFITGRNEKKIRQVAISNKISGEKIFAADLSNEEQVKQLKERYFMAMPGIDVLINASGIGIIKPVEQLTEDDFMQTINTNLYASFLLVKTFLPPMKEMKKGLIINIPGVLGKVPMAGAAAYSASKYGLVGMMQSIREELKRTEIRITNLFLGGVDSAFWDTIDLRVQRDKMIIAEEAAKAIWFLCQQPASGVVSEMVLQPFNHQAI